MRRALATLMSIVMLAVVPAALTAQTPAQPSVTVVPFTAEPGTRLSRDDAAQAADELAVRLVESGRYRVLQHAWLPLPDRDRRTASLQTLRTAASGAGVDYLVMASVRTSRTRPVTARPPVIPVGRSPIGMGRGLPFLSQPYRVAPQTMITITLRMVDVESGDIARTLVVQKPAAGSGKPPAAALAPGLLGHGPAGAVGLIAAVIARHRSAKELDRGLVTALDEAARSMAQSSLELGRGVR